MSMMETAHKAEGQKQVPLSVLMTHATHTKYATYFLLNVVDIHTYKSG